jgi:ribosome-binding protein aMBF1 (putative translation factor)
LAQHIIHPKWPISAVSPTEMANEASNEYLIKFGHHLKTIRKSKSLSFRKLATKCNVEHADIARYEKGELNMSFNTLIELSLGLEIPLKELMDF